MIIVNAKTKRESLLTIPMVDCLADDFAEARAPLGGDSESGNNQKNANEVGTDGPARRPRRNGWKATEVVSMEEALRAEGGDADGEQDAAEVAEEEHRVFGVQ
jgi:hypothetical protein